MKFQIVYNLRHHQLKFKANSNTKSLKSSTPRSITDVLANFSILSVGLVMKTPTKNFPGFQPLNLTMLKISFLTSILHTPTNLDLYLVYNFFLCFFSSVLFLILQFF